MNVLKSFKYPSYIDNENRVFHDFDAFLSFFRKNKKSIKAIKVNPSRLGSNNFGSVEVKIKKSYHG